MDALQWPWSRNQSETSCDTYRSRSFGCHLPTGTSSSCGLEVEQAVASYGFSWSRPENEVFKLLFLTTNKVELRSFSICFIKKTVLKTS